MFPPDLLNQIRRILCLHQINSTRSGEYYVSTRFTKPDQDEVYYVPTRFTKPDQDGVYYVPSRFTKPDQDGVYNVPTRSGRSVLGSLQIY